MTNLQIYSAFQALTPEQRTALYFDLMRDHAAEVTYLGTIVSQLVGISPYQARQLALILALFLAGNSTEA